MNVHALIPIFYVANVDNACEFYTGTLGFTQAFRYGTYAGLRLEEHEIHITDPGEGRQIIGAGSAYVICEDVDGYFRRITAAGDSARSEPCERAYGMRNLSVLDPDGNQLTFGCSLPEERPH